MKAVYLDQNILSGVANGEFQLPNFEGIKWLFSCELANEICRSQNREKFVSALITIGAVPIYRGQVLDGPNIDVLSFLKGVFSFLDSDRGTELKNKQHEVARFEAAIASRDIEAYRESLGLAFNGVPIGLEKFPDPIDEIWKLLRHSANKSEERKDAFFQFSIAGEKEFLEQGVYNCVAVLNRIGFFPDKSFGLDRNLSNVTSDRLHIAQAVNFDGIFSADKRLCEKARAIYQWKKSNCTVFYPVSPDNKIHCEERPGLVHVQCKSLL